FPSIFRKENFANAVAAIKRDAFHNAGLTRTNLGPVAQAGDKGADIQTVDGNSFLGGRSWLNAGAGVIRDPVGGTHPIASEDLIDDVDLVQMFHPISAIIARHNQPERIAVEHWQVFA